MALGTWYLAVRFSTTYLSVSGSYVTINTLPCRLTTENCNGEKLIHRERERERDSDVSRGVAIESRECTISYLNKVTGSLVRGTPNCVIS